jgi:hypothetical protein
MIKQLQVPVEPSPLAGLAGLHTQHGTRSIGRAILIETALLAIGIS